MLTLLMFAMSLPWRMPHVDDAWLGEHSYWLAREGVVKSKLMNGIAGSEERLVLHHKLHTWIGAVAIRLGGFNMHLLKGTSLIFLMLSLMLSLHLGKRTGLVTSPQQRVLLLILLLANPLIFEFGFIFRPEMLLTGLVLLSFLFLHKAAADQGNQYLSIILSGIFSGLALVAHLNGSVFVAAGFVSLLVMRRWTGALAFGTAASVAALLYFADFRGVDDFSLWYHQLTFIPNGRSTGSWWMHFLLNLRDEHMRYFHSPKEIVFTLLIVFSLLTQHRRLWRDQQLLLVYTLAAMFFLGLLGLHKTTKYIIPVLPFWGLIIVSALSEGMAKNRVPKWGQALAGMVLIVSLVYNSQVVARKYDPLLNAQMREVFAGSRSDSLKVAAPMEFIFDELDNFESIQGLMAWSELQKIDPDLKGEELLRRARAQEVDLILLNRHNQRSFGMQAFESGRVCQGYLLKFKSPQLMVWSRVPGAPQLSHNPVTEYREGLFKFSSAIR